MSTATDKAAEAEVGDKELSTRFEAVLEVGEVVVDDAVGGVVLVGLVVVVAFTFLS